MVSTSRRSPKPERAPITDGQFQFISVQYPDDAKNQVKRSLARSHAVKQALERKRKLQQESRDNFRAATFGDKHKRLVGKPLSSRNAALTTTLFSISAGVIDPFQALAVDSTRLQTMLSDYTARQAPEPVFAFAQEFSFQNFRSVFLTGLADPAILNATMLSFAFAVTGGSINRECLGYQSQAISHIRRKMSCLDEATSESTIGAILLLAGVEARLGMTSQVQLHMGAVQQLLKICQTKSISLTSGIKRAIFWQDLNCSILVGSKRIVDHTTFAELQWTRDPFLPHFFRVPPGFDSLSGLLTDEFVEVLQDIQALQCIRDSPRVAGVHVTLMVNINSHIASIQSRLVDLSVISPILECCYLAAYLCSAMLCCKVWCALVIPVHVSSKLLRKLQQTIYDSVWEDHTDLLLWILCIGGAFARKEGARSDYVALLRSNNAARSAGNESWPRVLEILKQFTWSEQAFTPAAKVFWEETCPPQ